MAVGSFWSTRLAPSSTLAPRESRTRMLLRLGSMGSVNQTATVLGGSSTTELGAGSDRT